MYRTLKERYGNGVYAIVNTKTGWIYVGQTAYYFPERWTTHRRDLRKGNHHCYQLQMDWNYFGEEVFEFRVLEYLPRRASREDHLTAEHKHMELHDRSGKLYNSRE